MAQQSRRRIQRFIWPLLVTLLPLLFYLSTLAPTVLWGDDAYFQRTAFTGELRPDGGGHWLWLQLARLFLRLPWGDVAFRSNLLSAFAAAGTILVLFAAARQIGLLRDAAAIAVISLAVGHTFWMHAVRAEVYTVFTFFVALHIWLWARWHAMPEAGSFGGARALHAGAALFGVTLLAHQMALFLLPAWFVLIWQQRRSLSRSQLVTAAIFFVLGLAPFVVVMQVQIAAVAGVPISQAMWLYLTQAGADFGPSLFDYSLVALPGDIAMWALLTILQFVSPALGLIAWGLMDRGRARLPGAWASLLVFYVVVVLFAVSYRVNDRYAFLLPGYLALALFAGAGWQAVRGVLASRWERATQHRVARAAFTLCLVLVATMPIAVYYIAPRALTALDLNPMGVRDLPGREPNEFFLWPGKAGYTGALRYGQETLAALPPDATLIADHTPLETVKYMQEVAGLRPDLRLLKIEPDDDLALLVSSLPSDEAIFLADDNPDYYNLRNLPEATLVATGPVFRLESADD